MTIALVSPFYTAPVSRMSAMEYDETTLPADLIRAAQSGDESAFNSIVRACKGRLLAMASRYVHSAAELDDLAQDIFVHLWKGLPSYRFDAPFPHWVSRVAVNTCLTHIKKRKRRAAIFVTPPEGDNLDRMADCPSEIDSSARDAAERLRPALESLRPEDRLLITLLHLEEKPVAEVACITGWSESNVKVRAMRVRQKLKDYLTRHEHSN